MKAETKPLVGILGLKKDRPLLGKTTDTLKEFEVPFDLQTFSKRNTFLIASNYAMQAEERGLQAIITSDRFDNPISSIVYARTRVPIIVIPTIDIPANSDSLDFRVLKEHLVIFRNTLYSPAAVMSINEPGAINAALFAVNIAAGTNPRLGKLIDDYREKMTEAVRNTIL